MCTRHSHLLMVIGHTSHEWTSYSSKEAIFKLFTERLKERSAGGDVVPTSPVESGDSQDEDRNDCEDEDVVRGRC